MKKRTVSLAVMVNLLIVAITLAISLSLVAICDSAYYHGSSGKFELYKDPHGFVLGGRESVRYKEYVLSLQPGDKLFVYTDGVPEATAGGGEMFGSERMLAALNGSPSGSPEEILAGMRRAVDAFVGDAEQFDDMTMLCLEYHGPESRSLPAGEQQKDIQKVSQ